MRLSLNAVLIAIFGILMLGLGLQGGLAVYQIGIVNAGTTDIATNWLPSVHAVGELKYTMSRLRLLDSRYLIGKEAPADLARIGEERTKAVATALRAYEPLVSSAEEKALFDQIEQSYAQYDRLRAELPAAMRSGDPAATLALFDGARPVFDTLMKLLDQDAKLNNAGSLNAQATSKAAYETAIWITLAVCGGAILLGLAGILFVLRGVTRPIARITQAMQTIAKGDLTAAIPYATTRNEIGTMAASLAVFRDGLLETERLRAGQRDVEAAAATRRTAMMQEMADGFEAAVSGIVGMVTASATELQATARSMSGTATRTAQQSVSVAAAAEEAASNVNTVAAAAEELG
ncbi:MCP four helix bundle domain-containing protein, partial [Methylobacterium trifolii]